MNTFGVLAFFLVLAIGTGWLSVSSLSGAEAGPKPNDCAVRKDCVSL